MVGTPGGLTPRTSPGFSFIFWVENRQFALQKKKGEVSGVASHPQGCSGQGGLSGDVVPPMSPAPPFVPSPLDPAQVPSTQSILRHGAPRSPSRASTDSHPPSPPTAFPRSPRLSMANPQEKGRSPLFCPPPPSPSKRTCGRRSRGGAGAAARGRWWPSPRPPW